MKRILCTILVAALGFSMISGCRNEESDESSMPSTTENGEDDTDSNTTTASGKDTTTNHTQTTSQTPTNGTPAPTKVTSSSATTTNHPTATKNTQDSQNAIDKLGSPNISYACNDGSVLSTYYFKAVKDFENVCAYYESAGYTCYSTMDVGGNLSKTYVKGGAMAHVYFHPSRRELNIVLSETAGSTLPPAKPAVTDGSYTCKIVQIEDNEHVNGMGYIIQLKDGSYIVYDGAYASQVPKIKKYLAENHKGGGKPIIRAWVLTHSHDDHYPAFKALAEAAATEDMPFVLENVILSPLNPDAVMLGNNDRYLCEQVYRDAANFKGTKMIFAHTGMKFTFCNLTMEVLYAPETYYKTTNTVGNFNNTSIVTRLTDGKYSALMLADVGIQGTDLMANLYGSSLKSDICQISHHGVEDVPLSFYKLVEASILFYPCNRALYLHERHLSVRQEMEKWACTKEILIAGVGQFERKWGTTFDKNAPLSKPW
ncbi:MAG: hypothetical protein IJ518_00500 [Clostridia bacterium]|nr:hypothetical protein [Clostridia bacterium]